MKSISKKKLSIIIVLTVLFAVFTTVSSFFYANANKNVAFADDETQSTITFLETKAKVSLDEKYLLLVTGFDSSKLDAQGLYYMGYKYVYNGTEVDTARDVENSKTATYYKSVTLRTDLEDETKTQVVTPETIYGEQYADYGLIVYEIPFTQSFTAEKGYYSDIYAYIDQVNADYEIIGSYSGTKYQDKDEYRLENGNFENGMEGWTKDGDIGDVKSYETYWNGTSFNSVGKFFSAYTRDTEGKPTDAEGGNEDAVGTLTSSVFTVGGTGWITYKFGGAKRYDQVYLEVVEDETNVVLARFYNSEWTEADNRGCQLIDYRADLSEFTGKKVYIRVTDNGLTDGYRLFFLDEVVTYYSTVPANGYEAQNILVNVVNGSFDKDFYGWTMDGDIGSISEDAHFWNETNEINNSGKYFRGDADGKEPNYGTLTSADFIVAGSGYITFKLGAAGSEECYIALEKKTGNAYETVALWHNEMWSDGAGHEQEVGYGLRMVDYKADLSAYLGETMRIVLHDGQTGSFKFFTFDELKTYYTSQPAGNLIENQMTVRAAFTAALAAEDINAQGDYTEDSYAAYTAKRTFAESLGEHAKIAAMNAALTELEAAKAALTLRVPQEVENAVKTYTVYANDSTEITLADLIDDNNLTLT